MNQEDVVDAIRAELPANGTDAFAVMALAAEGPPAPLDGEPPPTLKRHDYRHV